MFVSLEKLRRNEESNQVQWIRRIQSALLVSGIVLVGVYAVALLHRTIISRWAIAEVRAAQEVGQGIPNSGQGSAEVPRPDFTLWSPGRVTQFKSAMAGRLPPVLGVLRIPKSHLEAPIFEGTDDLTLNEGVGHIAGTDPIGGEGNTGIAGHRDGFFRSLKDVKVGDRIELEMRGKPLVYVVERLVIVDPRDVSVLSSLGHPELTLVTCYPFYVLGSAPRRFIVQASRLPSEQEKEKSESSAQ
jgi:sortase A